MYPFGDGPTKDRVGVAQPNNIIINDINSKGKTEGPPRGASRSASWVKSAQSDFLPEKEAGSRKHM